MSARRVLAADVGGTKTLLQILELREGGWEILLERRFESDLYPTFESMLREFLAGTEPVGCACFAVAGPVHDRTARVTNLPWIIDADKLGEELRIGRVVLINDFYAVAAGVSQLGGDDLVAIHDVPRDPHAPIAILGAGTGLGEAVLLPSGKAWKVLPSEGGHADFAPANPLQDELLVRLRARYGHVSWERVVSGMGLVNILTFLRDTRPELGAHDFTAEVADDDLPPLIAREDAAGNPLAKAAFDLFVDAYAAEAGNLALKVLARGGVFLAGGIAAKNLRRFRDGRFVRSFTDKGRFRDFVLECPVYVIANARVGLIGAAWMAKRAAESE